MRAMVERVTGTRVAAAHPEASHTRFMQRGWFHPQLAPYKGFTIHPLILEPA